MGQTYERCDNLIRMSFNPPAQTRPLAWAYARSSARCTNGGFRTGMLELQHDYELARPTQNYDLNLTTDIPLDSFLIVAPSEEGKWPTSLGIIF